MSEEFSTKVNKFLEEEHKEALFRLEWGARCLGIRTREIESCAKKYREGMIDAEKQLQLIVAVETLESVLQSTLYRLKDSRDRIDTLLRLRHEDSDD